MCAMLSALVPLHGRWARAGRIAVGVLRVVLRLDGEKVAAGGNEHHQVIEGRVRGDRGADGGDVGRVEIEECQPQPVDDARAGS